jgi:hypothetical protein
VSETRFTPGPWDIPKLRYIIIDIDGGNCHAEDCNCESARVEFTNEADANLIVAAPDLYAALEAVERRFSEFMESEYGDSNTDELRIARRALAAARGERTEGEG